MKKPNLNELMAYSSSCAVIEIGRSWISSWVSRDSKTTTVTNLSCLQHWFVRFPFSLRNLDITTKSKVDRTNEIMMVSTGVMGTLQYSSIAVGFYLRMSVVYLKGFEKVKYVDEFFTPVFVIDLK